MSDKPEPAEATPETDAAAIGFALLLVERATGQITEIIPADFARSLERQRNALAARLATAQEKIEALTRERDESQTNYQFMVNQVGSEHLEGYRELGAKCAALEERAEVLTAIIAEFLSCPCVSHELAALQTKHAALRAKREPRGE